MPLLFVERSGSALRILNPSTEPTKPAECIFGCTAATAVKVCMNEPTDATATGLLDNVSWGRYTVPEVYDTTSSSAMYVSPITRFAAAVFIRELSVPLAVALLPDIVHAAPSSVQSEGALNPVSVQISDPAIVSAVVSAIHAPFSSPSNLSPLVAVYVTDVMVAAPGTGGNSAQ